MEGLVSGRWLKQTGAQGSGLSGLPPSLGSRGDLWWGLVVTKG